MENKSVCFSGHRPHKLPSSDVLINMLKSRLYQVIVECAGRGYSEFYTGCALGVDMWAALIVLELKKDNPDIKLHCVIPYKGHSKKWHAIDRYDLDCVLSAADSVCCLSEKYYRGCFSARNKYIVDHSSLLIAVFRDVQSGTGQTVRYAEKRGIDVIKLRFDDEGR